MVILNRRFLFGNNKVDIALQNVEAFSGEKFNVKDWVNSTFEKIEGTQTKEVNYLPRISDH